MSHTTVAAVYQQLCLLSRREDGSMPHIYLKREDLNHTGAHKINNALGQALLCKRMGKHRIIAETGAGQHGVATVSSCMSYLWSCSVSRPRLIIAAVAVAASMMATPAVAAAPTAGQSP
eukprot:GHUV01029744.1.p4 GENE.GHUV01029744.1~~GHUV01029744.1.p4  ORF type:complete len:119 (-),score=41.70 GHUV01029744.1:1294-1650(-)